MREEEFAVIREEVITDSNDGRIKIRDLSRREGLWVHIASDGRTYLSCAYSSSFGQLLFDLSRSTRCQLRTGLAL